MKRLIYVLLIIMLSSQVAIASSGNIDSCSIEMLSDGSYFITTIEEASSECRPSQGISALSSQRTETKTKTTYYKNPSGVTLWYVRVTGTFSYGNGTSKCITYTPYASSNNIYWKVSDISGSKSGNTATASATGKYVVHGKVLEIKQKSVRLSCSPTGVFS